MRLPAASSVVLESGDHSVGLECVVVSTLLLSPSQREERGGILSSTHS